MFIFEFIFRFGFNYHYIILDLVSLCLDLSAPTRQIAVFFFASNMVVKRYSDFLELGFLTGVGFMGDIVLLSVNTPRVETIASSRISLTCCWSSHSPAYLYNFLMFSRYLCSYIELFLKDRWIPIVCKWYFSRSDFNIPLSTTHCCSNVSIERTESITLVIVLDLIHLAAWSDLPSFKNTYIIYQPEVISYVC